MLLASISIFLPPLRSQLTEEEKKKLFLKAREDIRPVPRPSPSATPRPKPKIAPTPTPVPPSTPKPKREPEEVEPSPRPKPTATPKRSPTPDVIPLESPEPSPSPTPRGERLDAPILIEKSGLEQDQGLEPVKPRGGLFRRWRYLTPAVRRAIDQAKVKKGRWKYVIVHNSGTRQGNARIFDRYHRRIRKMHNGLAYHFVIGNGRSSGNGQIEIGSRWTRQINGGHVASDYLNNIAIGICLVGDLNRVAPTQAQVAALEELVTYLRGRVGKIKGRQAIVLPHKKINPRPTDCPGDRFPYGWLRRKFGS